MKNVIENHTYDTDFDKLIDTKTNGLATDSDMYYEENLYLNRAGIYYIHSIAGINADLFSYGSSTSFSGGAHSYGARIKPLTDEEAEAWKKSPLKVPSER
jgi:hypothetical protein